jgi:hypothetical protein
MESPTTLGSSTVIVTDFTGLENVMVSGTVVESPLPGPPCQDGHATLSAGRWTKGLIPTTVIHCVDGFGTAHICPSSTIDATRFAKVAGRGDEMLSQARAVAARTAAVMRMVLMGFSDQG